MNIQEINNFFGDMDLFLLDFILKGHIQRSTSVLDVGCGEGRNGIFFIQHGFEYQGWDIDNSKIQLLNYLANTINGSNVVLRRVDLRESLEEQKFDIIICSRVLHFAASEADFFDMWDRLTNLLKTDGIVYLSMDSIVDSNLGVNQENGKISFPDGKTRFALTNKLYEQMKKGFEEIEPLKTLVYRNERAQSFMFLRKN